MDVYIYTYTCKYIINICKYICIHMCIIPFIDRSHKLRQLVPFQLSFLPPHKSSIFSFIHWHFGEIHIVLCIHFTLS